MVFNATFNNISAIWLLVLLVEETGVPRENQRLATSLMNLSQNGVSSTPHHELDLNAQLKWL